jgi:hypothetical protein
MNFGLIFCTVVDPIIMYIKIFCLDFFETLKCHFRIFLENGLHGARAPLEVFAATNDRQGKKQEMGLFGLVMGRARLGHVGLRAFVQVHSNFLSTF